MNNNLKLPVKIFAIFLFLSVLSIFQPSKITARTSIWDYSYPSNESSGNDITVDNMDNIIFVGPAGSNGFIRKYNTAGTLLWERLYPLGSGGGDNFEEVDTDSSGNIYIGGNTYNLQTSSSVGIILKYSANGDLIWAQQMGDGVRMITGLAVGGNNLYVSGVNDSSHPGYIKKYTLDGTQLWIQTQEFINPGSSNSGGSLAIDSQENIYINDRSNIYKFNSASDLIWIKNFASNIWLHTISTTRTDEVITAGLIDTSSTNVGNNPYYWDGYMARLAPDGSEIWTKNVGQEGADNIFTITEISDNSVVVAGTAYGDFPGYHGTDAYDGFIQSFTATGTPIWTHQFVNNATLGDINPSSIDGDSLGGLALAGTYNYISGGNSYSRARIVYFPEYQNDPPIADAGPDRSVNEGQMITFDGSNSYDSDGTNDIISYTWNFGDGSTSISGVTVNHVYVDNGTYTTTLTVTDTANHTSVNTAIIIVNNVIPTVASIYTQPAYFVGELTQANASFTDLGILDSHISSWDWGDGIVTQGDLTEEFGSGSITGSHIYASSGIYTITLTVTDNDGGVGYNIFQVTIQSPVQAISSLIVAVQTFNLQQGIENSLDQKLQNAVDSLNAENAGNRTDTINKLEAFINAVQAQSGNQITIDQANTLVQAASSIIDLISTP